MEVPALPEEELATPAGISCAGAVPVAIPANEGNLPPLWGGGSPTGETERALSVTAYAVPALPEGEPSSLCKNETEQVVLRAANQNLT